MSYHEGAWHRGVIVSAISQYEQPLIYIEIGIRDAACFNTIYPLVQEAHGVDIDEQSGHSMTGGTFYNMSSDEFFEVYDGPKAHLIFIDGDRSYEQAKKDYRNAHKHLRKDGTIALHGTWPVVKENAVPGVCDGVWQLAATLEKASIVNAYTFRKFPGVTLVTYPLDRW